MKLPSWISIRPLRHYKGDDRTKCPDCGGEMSFVERFTMSGDDRRTYRCQACNKEHIVDFGMAEWKRLSDANKPEG
jgi:transposase-like protein